MTDTKFTPPTELPANYATTNGLPATITHKINNATDPWASYIGFVTHRSGEQLPCVWSNDGWCFQRGSGGKINQHVLSLDVVGSPIETGEYPMTDRKFTPPTEFPAEYVTRDGRKAVVEFEVPNCALNKRPFVGWVLSPDGSGSSCHWSLDGRAMCVMQDTLFDKPVTRTWWVNVYEDRFSGEHVSKYDADDFTTSGRIGLIRVDQVEGQMPTFTEVPIDE